MAYVTIKRSEHSALGYKPTQNLEFAKEMPLTSISWEEIPSISQHLPTAFRLFQHEGKNVLELVAIQSLDRSRNLMILPNGRWLGGYMPAVYRSEPFAMFPDKDDKKTLQLNIKEEQIAPTSEEGVKPFFNEAGELSDNLKLAMRFLGDLTKGYRQTQSMIVQLYKHGVLQPLDLANELNLEEDHAFPNLHTDLYRANLNKISELSDQAIAELQRSGALHLASLQYSSQFRLKGLMSLTKIYDEMSSKLTKPNEQPSIDQLFGEASDTFSF